MQAATSCCSSTREASPRSLRCGLFVAQVHGSTITPAGIPMRVIFGPGHTKGHVTLWVPGCALYAVSGLRERLSASDRALPNVRIVSVLRVQVENPKHSLKYYKTGRVANQSSVVHFRRFQTSHISPARTVYATAACIVGFELWW